MFYSKASYRRGDKVLHKDSIYDVWHLATVVDVVGDRYVIQYFGGDRLNQLIAADQLLPQSMLQDVSDTRKREKTAIGPRPIRFFDASYPYSFERAKTFNRNYIVPLRKCEICGQFWRDFVKHYKTHHPNPILDKTNWWFWWTNQKWKPPRLASIKRLPPIEQPDNDMPEAKRRKWEPGFENVIVPRVITELRTPARRRRQPNRRIRNWRIGRNRRIGFSPRTMGIAELQQFYTKLQKRPRDEDDEDDPFNTALSVIDEEDLEDIEDSPKRHPSIYDEDFKGDPGAGPSWK